VQPSIEDDNIMMMMMMIMMIMMKMMKLFAADEDD